MFLSIKVFEDLCSTIFGKDLEKIRISEKNNGLGQYADRTCPDDFHCSGRAGISIISVHSYVQNG